jgi:16S rRNA (guanine527-N7)-methyltransferase
VTPDEFAVGVDVSRETLARLTTYVALLERWQNSVNLVGKGTLNDIWRRHILDSAQLYNLLPSPFGRVVDLGSGAGFPGMVLAIMGATDVELIEANTRKCGFLREVARVTNTQVIINNDRIEGVAPRIADVVTARALAPLPRLLGYAKTYVGPETICLFLKGRRLHQELTDARKTWKMGITTITSLSDAGGSVLHLRKLSRTNDTDSPDSR